MSEPQFEQEKPTPPTGTGGDAPTSPSPQDAHRTHPPHNVTPADVFLWRRKKLSFSVLVAATLTWLLFDKVGYTPITMVSWVALFVVTVVFVSAHMASLFNRELPPIPKLEIKEQWTAEMASVLSERLNNIARWVHEMGTRRDYMRFARVVAGLGLLSVTGSWFDTLTTVYISLLLALILPPLYVKYNHLLNKYMESIIERGRRLYEMVDQKFLRKIKNRSQKEKKVE